MKKFLIIILCVAGGFAFKLYKKKHQEDQFISEQQELQQSLAQQQASQLSIEEKTLRMIEAYKAATEKFNTIQDQETANQQAGTVLSEIQNIALMDLKLKSDHLIAEHEKIASFSEQASHSNTYREAVSRLLPFYGNNEEVSSMIKAAAPVLTQ